MLSKTKHHNKDTPIYTQILFAFDRKKFNNYKIMMDFSPQQTCLFFFQILNSQKHWVTSKTKRLKKNFQGTRNSQKPLTYFKTNMNKNKLPRFEVYTSGISLWLGFFLRLIQRLNWNMTTKCYKRTANRNAQALIFLISLVGFPVNWCLWNISSLRE